MLLKTCSFCKKQQSLVSFYKRKTGVRSGQFYEKCKDCMKARGRRYYHENRDRQLSLALKRRHKAYLLKRDYINKVKNRPCADCDIEYPFYVMDLDHRKGTLKVNDIGRMTNANWSLEKIKKEVEKCEVVCANCHKIRTFQHLSR